MPRLKLLKMKSKRPPQTIIEIETNPGVHRTSKVQKLHFRVIPNTHQNSHQNPSYFPYTKSHTIIFFDVTLNGFWFMNNIKFMKRFRRRYSPTFPRRTFSQKCSKMNLRWQDVTRVMIFEVPIHEKNWDFWRFFETRDCEEITSFWYFLSRIPSLVLVEYTLDYPLKLPRKFQRNNFKIHIGKWTNVLFSKF